MSTNKTTKQIGDEWEQKARYFLEEKGYDFVINNYRFGRNEVDLIFKDGEVLVFVEVKFRKDNRFGNPEDFVETPKLERIMAAAENYVFDNNWEGNIRFDVIAVMPKEIIHFEDIS